MSQLRHLPLLALCVELCSGCGSKVQVTVKVLDDNNHPVPNAKVVIMGFNTQKEGNTDKQGFFPAKLRNVTGQLDLSVEKEGFYTINWVSYYFTGQTNGQWKPWNPIVELQLRKRGNPVPMVVKCLKGLPIPAKGQSIGYDLLVGDWVSPNGKGEVSDFIFAADANITDRNNFSGRLLLTFSNPGDGLILRRMRYRDDYGLRLPADAPAVGYTNSWEYILNAKQNPNSGHRDVRSTASEDDNYYLRVRTKQSGNGSVISAMYGKIYRGIRFEPGLRHEGQPTVSFEYFLNPSGTRNTEWDTRSNLCANPGDVGGRP